MGGVFTLILSSISTFLLLSDPEDGELKAPSRVDAPIRAVHVPGYLDSNDVAQFMIEVEFPNSCYALGKVIVRARAEDLEEGIIPFHLEALKYDKPGCLQVKTKTLKVVDVGILPSGRYQLRGLKDMKYHASVNVAKAENRATDNFTYAPVDALFLRNDPMGFRRIAVLVGSFRNTCMRFKEKLPVLRAGDTTRVLEILPIVEMERDKICLEQTVPFMQPVEIPDSVESGEYVFHVRTMNGNSLNKLDTIRME